MELIEEKLADSLKLAMERREMKRKAEAAGTAVTVSREEAVRGYIEKLLTDGGTFSGGASSGNASEASAQNQGEGYDSCLRRPVLAIISFNYGYEGFSSDFTREDQKKVISFAENIIEQMVKGYFDHSCLVRRELNSLVLVMSTDGIEDYREQIRSLGEKIISVVKDYFEVSVSVAVSSRKESLGEFGALLYEAMSATNHYFYHSLDPVVFYSEECETSARHTGSFHIGFLKKDLSQAVALNDSGRLEEILDQVACLLRSIILPAAGGQCLRQSVIFPCPPSLRTGRSRIFPMRSILWKSWDGWGPWGRSYSGLTGLRRRFRGFWSGAGIPGWIRLRRWSGSM